MKGRFTMHYDPQDIHVRPLYAVIRLRPVACRKPLGTTITVHQEFDWSGTIETASAWCVSQAEIAQNDPNITGHSDIVWVGELLELYDN